MAVDATLAGREYPAFTYEVSREKLREYGIALGETEPRLRGEGEDCVAPPTFAATFTLARALEPLFADEQLGMHWNLVHGSQRFEFGRPLRPGDVLSCTTRFADVTTRMGSEFVRVEVDCRLPDGELACAATATLVLFDEDDS